MKSSGFANEEPDYRLGSTLETQECSRTSIIEEGGMTMYGNEAI